MQSHSQSSSRRAFLKRSAAGFGLLALNRPLNASPGRPISSRSLRLTTSGGDRATGYVMSNKIARRDGHLVCTWLDVERQNRWAAVDLQQGKVVHGGTIGPPLRDNHCGAAMATDVDGTLHLLIGAHHGSFVHYRLPPERWEWEPVEEGRAVGRLATYPSLVCDRRGTLHVTYRLETGGRDAQLMHCRREKDGRWTEPRSLVRSAVSEHSWLTNAIETDRSGRLHAVFSNTQPVAGHGSAARYYGASHIYSDDSGHTWRQFGNRSPLPPAADAARLRRIEGSAMMSNRLEENYGGPRGPLNSYYHKMVLSNPAVDRKGRPWVIVHNLLAGDALLCRFDPPPGWVATPLAGSVRQLLPGYRIRHCGQLSLRGDGLVEAVLMTSPASGVGWGDPGSTLVRLLADQFGRIVGKEALDRPRADTPDWLPSLERSCPHAPLDQPALLYTRGANAGGYSNNINRVETDVWLRIPPAAVRGPETKAR